MDEAPQFFNVLKGQMSLVGTRPPMIEEVEEYKPEHLKRISAKPGITGLWQVSGRNKITDFEQIVELDCSYLDSWRFADDLKILMKTILVVLQRKGAIYKSRIFFPFDDLTNQPNYQSTKPGE